MADRRLAVAKRHAAAASSQHGSDGKLDTLLAAMGSKRAASALTAAATPVAPRAPRTVGVGEEVWDPTVLQAAHAPADAAVGVPSVPTELLRAQALRKLQAGVEEELLRTLGPEVVGKLEVTSSVTLRNGNGLVDRWLAERRLAAAAHAKATPAPPASDPLLPLPYSAAAEAPELAAELQRGGASAESAAEAAVGLGRVADETLEGLRRRSLKPPPLSAPTLVRANPNPRGGFSARE
eukprot:6323536-Prymnesium_polylepis.2